MAVEERQSLCTAAPISTGVKARLWCGTLTIKADGDGVASQETVGVATCNTKPGPVSEDDAEAWACFPKEELWLSDDDDRLAVPTVEDDASPPASDASDPLDDAKVDPSSEAEELDESRRPPKAGCQPTAVSATAFERSTAADGEGTSGVSGETKRSLKGTNPRFAVAARRPSTTLPLPPRRRGLSGEASTEARPRLMRRLSCGGRTRLRGFRRRGGGGTGGGVGCRAGVAEADVASGDEVAIGGVSRDVLTTGDPTAGPGDVMSEAWLSMTVASNTLTGA